MAVYILEGKEWSHVSVSKDHGVIRMELTAMGTVQQGLPDSPFSVNSTAILSVALSSRPPGPHFFLVHSSKGLPTVPDFPAHFPCAH